MVYPHKWSPISYRSSTGQRKHAGQRPPFYRWTTQPTVGTNEKANQDGNNLTQVHLKNGHWNHVWLATIRHFNGSFTGEFGLDSMLQLNLGEAVKTASSIPHSHFTLRYNKR